MTERELNHLIQAKVYEQAQKYRPTNLAIILPWIAVGILLVALAGSHFWHVGQENKLEAALMAQGKLTLKLADDVAKLSEASVSHEEGLSTIASILADR